MSPAKSSLRLAGPPGAHESPRDSVDRARAAREAWSAVPISQRLALIRRFRWWLADESERFVEVLRPGNRRPAAEALSAEIVPLADACRFLERRARRILAPRRLGRSGRPLWLTGSKAEVRREPLGVVLVIGAANYPLLLPGVQALQALVAGNAVLIKPGLGGGGAARLLVEGLRRAGLDDAVAAVLPETPSAASDAIAEGVDKVVLTGSAKTGREVLAQLVEPLTPAALELSGCDAVFVRDDADLGLVADAVRFGLSFNGSATCIAPRRLYVGRERAAELEKMLIRALAALPPVELEVPTLARARELVRGALSEGARSVIGNAPGDEGFRPTVLADVPPGAAVLRSEIFAPILSVVAVSDDEEALRHADSCPYALGATVFGETAAARALAGRVRAGVVVINDMIVPTADPRLPFGGRGESGFGVTRGAEGLLELTVPKVLIARGGRRRPHLEPLSGGEEDLFRGYLRAVHGRGLRARLAALGETIRGLGSLRNNSKLPSNAAASKTVPANNGPANNVPSKSMPSKEEKS